MLEDLEIIKISELLIYELTYLMRRYYIIFENSFGNISPRWLHIIKVSTLIVHPPWNYNIRRNVNSGFPFVTIRRVAIIYFEMGVVKNFM